MKSTFRNAIAGVASCSLVALAFGSVHALVIELNYGAAMQDRPEVRSGIRDAADLWEAVLADPVTVRVDARTAPIPELGLNIAATYVARQVFSYADVRTALATDARTDDDLTAVSHLPAGPLLTFHTVDPQGNRIINAGEDGINTFLDFAQANAKALGLPLDAGAEPFDAELVLSELFLDDTFFDFDRSDGIVGMDFVGLCAHEIGHALGFNSGVDFVNQTSLPAGPDAPENINDFGVYEVLDLYRYSAESLPLLELGPGRSPYFSINGGETSLGPFSSGIFNGDGRQAGHWLEAQGILDALLPYDSVNQISPLDLQAMDVIGWEPVPEPSSAVLAVIGCIGLLAFVCHRRNADRKG